MKIYGIWYGGPSYYATYPTDLEVFPSLKVAKQALRDRYEIGYCVPCPTYYPAAENIPVLFPAVTRESRIDVFESGELAYRLVFGPRGGIRRERF